MSRKIESNTALSTDGLIVCKILPWKIKAKITAKSTPEERAIIGLIFKYAKSITNTGTRNNIGEI